MKAQASEEFTATIRAEGLDKEVTTPKGALSILSDIGLQINRGEAVAVVGASGSGKSTLLGLLAGLDLPTRGRIWLDGHEITALDEDGRARHRAGRVGFVFQSFHLLDAMSALENVMVPLELLQLPDAEARAADWLRRVGLQDRLDHTPAQLSGGEQQRVAIARAFAVEPGILFADEPTGNLDSRTGAQVADLLFELNASHDTTLVLVTHDPALADRCQRRLTLDAGRLV
ncbi:ABC transporter ATP-binding protein [Thiohalobacter thiocyanaticus]|uniref:ATP-binding cassette domain-containing protein n=1 Tax=Thiohalobacter thiocyanaticus TaxID=585455 RepID=A0A426QH70_9GAMM|nr:ATP-binding cassette domain-containing protein [Thiohalobacter thiocyanaticus]RRQ21080.1 ATP-binding cassette domain-containing protein [Thiohalobacter thiocyanaticus]